ncbi:MAG: sensor domain-containing diguanylate cyclase [Deltaproteobacteria bacterium]|uniref:Sensor domain-containing diguanylate cyclase n=1 Tax=Candidatus Zymogenus saltonus TaxID=2844893 RepID=A0A9D8KCU2_9DELT|nr:sensor domain-containing diguanylate cyclase [Candidatus Zymogenus saltonus]
MKNIDIRFFMKVAEELDMSVRFFDKNRKLIYINRYAEKLTGYTIKDVLNKTCGEFLEGHIDKRGNKLCDTNCPIDFTLKNKKIYEGRHYFKNKEGDTFPVEVKVMPVMNEGDKMIGAVEFMIDDRPRLAMEELKRDIQSMIPVDLLTGLYTKSKIMEYLEVKVEDCLRYGAPLGVIYVMLKNTENIKNELGPKKLDEVLQRVGYLIRMNTRKGDLSGRLGPNDFIILLPNFTEENTRNAAAKFKEIIVENSTTIFPGEIEVVTGTAQFQKGDSIDSLLKRARENARG